MTRQRRRANAARNPGFSAIGFERALMRFSPGFAGSSARWGTRPQRSASPRGAPSRSVVTARTWSPGATLKRWRTSTRSPIGKRERRIDGSGPVCEERPHQALSGAPGGPRRVARLLLAPSSHEDEDGKHDDDEQQAEQQRAAA